MRRAVVTLLAGLLVQAAPASAEPPPDEGDWEFAITPYIWLPAMTGSNTVKGRTVEIDSTIGDLFTGTDFIFALQAQLETWYKQRFGFIFNGQWTRLDQNDNQLGPSDGPPFGPGVFPINFDLTMNLGLFEFLGAYRVGAWELGWLPTSAVFTLEPLLGARLTTLRATFDADGSDDLVQGKTWADPIMGTRMNLALGDEKRWRIRFRGDFGGFGAGSDFTWNLFGGFSYEFRPKTCRIEVLLGARALYQDYEDGSGDTRFAWDVTQYGPVLGLGIHF